LIFWALREGEEEEELSAPQDGGRFKIALEQDGIAWKCPE